MRVGDVLSRIGIADEAVSRILIVDDDDDVRSFIAQKLRSSGLEVDEASSGEETLQVLEHGHDLVLLDVDLPGRDGFSVLREIRRRFEVPVLMLTASGQESDRVLGFELGADDYVVKPFLPRELVARVHALLRRTAAQRSSAQGRVRSFGEVEVDLDASEARRNGVVLALTHKEFELLAHFVERPRQAQSREQLMRLVWRSDVEWQKPTTVTEHVRRLRRLIEIDPAFPRHLVTVRGVGYRFDP